jgi:hypothetical protein
MIWFGDFERIGDDGVAFFRYYHSSLLQGLKKTTNTSVRVVCMLTKILTGNLMNACQKCCPLNRLAL